MSVENNIPEHWQIVKLKSITENIQYGYTESSSKENIGPKFLRITDIQDNKVEWNDVPFCKIDNEIKSKYLLKDGDLVFARTGATVGKSFLIKGAIPEAVFASYLIRVRVNLKIDEKYLSYFFQSPNYWNQITEGQVGIGQPNVNGTKLGQLNITIAPLEEQLAIVSKIEELLSDLENGKQQLLTAQQHLKVYRQSLLKAAFEGKLSLNCDSFDLCDKDDFKKEALNHNNQNTHTNQGSDNLPKGWRWVKLGDVCLNVEYGSSTKSKKEGKTPVLRMGNIQKGIFDWTDLVYSDDDIEISKYLLKKNDVLFNRTNSAELVGKTAIYKGERPAIFAGYLIRINRIESMIDANYLTYYLNTLAAKQYGNSIRSFGVNQSNINGTKLKTYPIPLPTLVEQQQIVDALESKLTVCDKIEETIKEALLKSESLRQSILKKAFEGKLV